MFAIIIIACLELLPQTEIYLLLLAILLFIHVLVTVASLNVLSGR